LQNDFENNLCEIGPLRPCPAAAGRPCNAAQESILQDFEGNLNKKLKMAPKTMTLLTNGSKNGKGPLRPCRAAAAHPRAPPRRTWRAYITKYTSIRRKKVHITKYTSIQRSHILPSILLYEEKDLSGLSEELQRLFAHLHVELGARRRKADLQTECITY